MQIECTIRRDGGTHVELPGKLYHFAPTATEERHLTVVDIPSHVERFLSIPEAYRMAREPGAAEAPATFAPTPDKDIDPLTPPQQVLPSGYPALFTFGRKDYTLQQVAARALADSGLEIENWNDLPEDTHAIKIDQVLDALEAGEITLEEDPADVPPSTETAPPLAPAPVIDDRATLAAQYKAKFGKNPANTMKIDAIKAKLAE